jgi:asparagine synthase (glutamine-hydrolysing)
MCGIAGFIEYRQGSSTDGSVLEAMTNQLRSRGPDDVGAWTDSSSNFRLELGHRRLSIIDLSPAGHQPMHLTDRGLVIVFNGEIYNFLELRKELELAGHAFTSTSDTEVILHAYAEWGTDCFARLNGMWALAIWDQRHQELILSRDRLGIKPLVYYADERGFLFASELKSLVQHPFCSPEIDPEAIKSFFWFSYVPAPLASIKGTRKLGPGQFLRLKGKQIQIKSYWSLLPQESVIAKRFAGSENAAKAELEELLQDSVRRQMIADVPVGVFLSGGYDSSVVAALMSRLSSKPVKTFCVRLENADESQYARAVARHIQSEHYELEFRPQDLATGLASIGEVTDEPFGDAAILPTILLSQLVRKHVTVVLSGDGGDEVFKGYELYHRCRRAHRLHSLPKALRSLLAFGFEASGSARFRHSAPLLRARTEEEMHLLQISCVRPQSVPEFVSPEPGLPGDLVRQALRSYDRLDWESRVAIVDLLFSLPDCMLTKVDRASMRHSLEVRVPLLDHRVVEFALKLPREMTIRNGAGKWILKQVAHDLIPRHLLDRPKHGFSVPLGRWFSGELRGYAYDTLSALRRGEDPLVNGKEVQRLLDTHSRERNFGTQIFQLIAYAQWRQQLGQRWRQLS